METILNTLLLKGWTPGATGIWFIAALVSLMYLREWRETRKLSAEDRQARREGYAKQVESLTAENRLLRKEVQDVRSDARTEIADVQIQFDEYRKLCRLETDQLREEIRGLQDEITGMKRQEAGLHVAKSRRAIRNAEL